jgi:hypothetical protein
MAAEEVRLDAREISALPLNAVDRLLLTDCRRSAGRFIVVKTPRKGDPAENRLESGECRLQLDCRGDPG